MRGWYQKNRERVLKQQRERRTTSSTTRDYDRIRWHTDAVYRKKKMARIMVKQAIKRGKMTRQPCSVCGAEFAEAHHEDYTQPLEVVWLCPTHHRARHMEMAS